MGCRKGSRRPIGAPEWQAGGCILRLPGQPLREIPWERPPGVWANDTGGNLRANMEAVKAEDEAASRKRKG